jgi:hypothetical protein
MDPAYMHPMTKLRIPPNMTCQQLDTPGRTLWIWVLSPVCTGLSDLLLG